MVTKRVLAFLLVAVIGVCSAGGGGSHHKIVIHVPYTVKHHHHTHTIYKHIKEEKKEHKEPVHEHIHEHIEHPHEEEGKDHYELLGYTYGKSNHEESGKESQGHKGFGGSSHEHKFSGGSSKHNGGLFGSHSFSESKTSENHAKKGLGHFGPGHGRLISDYVGKLSGQSSFNHERASSADDVVQGFEKHGEIVKSDDGSHSSQFFGSKAGYDLLMKQGNSLGHSVDLEI